MKQCIPVECCQRVFRRESVKWPEFMENRLLRIVYCSIIRSFECCVRSSLFLGRLIYVGKNVASLLYHYHSKTP